MKTSRFLFRQFACAGVVIGLLHAAASVRLWAADAPKSSESPTLHVSVVGSGPFTYWLRSSTGAIVQLPKTVSGKQKIDVPLPANASSLSVMDSQSGKVASKTIQHDASGKLVPVSLLPSDYVLSQMDAPGAPPVVTSAPPASPEPKTAQSDASEGVNELIGMLVSLALAAGVVYVLLRVVNSRGTPLVDLARRAGIDVPDPNAPPEALAMPVAAPEIQRAIERIPDEAGLAPLPPRQSSSAARPHHDVPVLIGLQGIAAGMTVTLGESVVTLGRDGECSVVLSDGTVSRNHAQIYHEANVGYEISDLGSANGVVVNGARVSHAILQNGDEIQIGDNIFKFEM